MLRHLAARETLSAAISDPGMPSAIEAQTVASLASLLSLSRIEANV